MTYHYREDDFAESPYDSNADSDGMTYEEWDTQELYYQPPQPTLKQRILRMIDDVMGTIGRQN